MPNYLKNITQAIAPGTPVFGELAGTTVGAPLSAQSVPCSAVIIFPSSADADTYVGDEDSQPARLPSMPWAFPVDDVRKLWAKLSAGTGNIAWCAITPPESEEE
jgi:hypothetical protein